MKLQIPAREGKAVPAHAGETIVIRDVEGQQCVDFWAIADNSDSEYLSAAHTRVHLNRLFPRPGEQFVTNARRPILRFLEDHSPGNHDMLLAACDPARYLQLGADADHGSCAENFREALEALGRGWPFVPQSINWFMHIPVAPDGEITWEPIETRAGDYVKLLAELDCICVVSACPQDVTSLNAGRPTPVELEVER